MKNNPKRRFKFFRPRAFAPLKDVIEPRDEDEESPPPEPQPVDQHIENGEIEQNGEIQ